MGLGLSPDFLNARCVSATHTMYPLRVGRSLAPFVAREFPEPPRKLALNRGAFYAKPAGVPWPIWASDIRTRRTFWASFSASRFGRMFAKAEPLSNRPFVRAQGFDGSFFGFRFSVFFWGSQGGVLTAK